MSTSAIAEFSIPSWAEIRNTILRMVSGDDLSRVPGRFIFRGQRNASWGLTASFDRLTADLDAASRKAYYQDYMTELRRTIEANDYIELANYHRFAELDDTLVVEMIAQHHGAPTRILDWSLSPYIGAFFAIWNLSTEHDVHNYGGELALWALDTEEMTRLIGSESCDIINITATGNIRSLAQLGRFTRNKSIYGDLVELVHATDRQGLFRGSLPILYKYTIPLDQVDEINMDLALMGIDHIRMFPGIDSVCRFHRERLISRLKR